MNSFTTTDEISPDIFESGNSMRIKPAGPDILLDNGLTREFGEHSYIHDNQIRNPSGALTHIAIGKFSSIATGLTIIGYDHQSEWVAMYPFLDDWHRANCSKQGLAVVKSRVIDWELPGSDCITLFRKNPQL
jgi:hypothetical protein